MTLPCQGSPGGHRAGEARLQSSTSSSHQATEQLQAIDVLCKRKYANLVKLCREGNER